MTEFQIIIAVISITALIPATWIPLHIFRAKIFNTACLNFRNAFDVAIYHIENGHDEVTVIESNFPAHVEAIKIFAHHLRGRKLTRFNEAWAKYQKWYDAVCNRGTTSKLFPENDSQYLEMNDIKGKTFIEELLKFAELKK